MKTYKVRITEYRYRVIETTVEAEDEDAAFEKVDGELSRGAYEVLFEGLALEHEDYDVEVLDEV